MNRSIQRHAHDDGEDRWEIVDARPEARLRGVVDRYSWWSEETRTFTARRELASTTGVLIVNLGSDLEIVDASGRLHRLACGQGFIGGTAQATSVSRSIGAMQGVHVHAPLLTLGRIAGVPVAELGDRVVPLDDLRLTKLGDRLADAGTHEQRWTALDGCLSERLGETRDDSATVYALARLAAGVRVQAVADHLGWSRKRLANHLRAEVGVTPRAFARLARFERFTRLLQTDPGAPLAQVAVDAGYADQPHLTRDVTRYAAMTPGELRRRLIPAGGGVRD